MWKLALACLAALPFSASAGFATQAPPYAPNSLPLDVQKVPGAPIYFSVGNPGIPAKENEGNTSNAGFVVTPDGVVVFDALGTPSLGWMLLQKIKEITDRPIRYVVVSHYHADHIYGLQAFKDHTGAVIVAEERASEYHDQTADERAAERLDQRRQALFPWVDRNTKVVAPDMTYSERATIVLGGKRFVLFYAGPAHSSSDAMMMVEPDGVLFAGDIVQNGRIPFMNSGDVDTTKWLLALDEVEKLNPRFIIPGHGQASTEAKEAIAFTRDYIRFVRAAMREAVESWTDFDVAYERTDWSKYENVLAFKNNNRGNAYRIFLEMEQAQARTEKR